MRLDIQHLKPERKWQKEMEVCSAWLDYWQLLFPSICFKAFAGVFLSHFPLFMKFILSCALMAETKGVLYLFACNASLDLMNCFCLCLLL